MNKRIIFAVTNDLNHDRRMHRICSTLHEAGYSVTLVGRLRRNSEPLEPKEFHQHRIRCIAEKGIAFYAEYNIRLFLFLIKIRADIFSAVDLDTILAVTCAGGLRNKKRVFDAHEYFTEVPEVERRAGVKKVWSVIGKGCVPRFDLRYTVGNELAKVLGDIYSRPFSVIRNLPQLQSEAIIPFDGRDKRIVYIGTLNEGRGLEHAIDAMSALPDFTLQLIGEGDLSHSLRMQAAGSAASDRIFFAGWISPDQLSKTISTAMFALNVLEPRSRSYYYSLANKFFDYIHAGVPSINMAFPEYENIIGEYKVGVTIDNLSGETIAATILDLYRSPEQIKDMIRRCAMAKQVLNWHTEEHKLLELYQSI